MAGRTKTPTDDTRTKRDEQRRAFARELDTVANELGLSQAELARILGMAQQTISKYITSEQPPDNPEVVFEIERKLGIVPGGLSHTLGYMPLEHVSTPAAISNDPGLSPAERKMLLTLYRNLLIVHDSFVHGSPKA